MKFFICFVVFFILHSRISSQVFVTREVCKNLPPQNEIVKIMNQAQYSLTRFKSLPKDLKIAVKKLNIIFDKSIGKTKKEYYINKPDGSFLMYGIKRKNKDFSFVINCFFGNDYAVIRIKEIFINSSFVFDYEDNGILYYINRNHATAIIGAYDNGLIVWGYFEL